MAQAKIISNMSRNPERAFIAMKQVMRKTVGMVQAVHRVELFNELNRKKIPTRPVGQMCGKLCLGLTGNKTRELQQRVMKWKAIDAKKSAIQAKRENTKTWRNFKPAISETT